MPEMDEHGKTTLPNTSHLIMSNKSPRTIVAMTPPVSQLSSSLSNKKARCVQKTSFGRFFPSAPFTTSSANKAREEDSLALLTLPLVPLTRTTSFSSQGGASSSSSVAGNSTTTSVTASSSGKGDMDEEDNLPLQAWNSGHSNEAATIGGMDIAMDIDIDLAGAAIIRAEKAEIPQPLQKTSSETSVGSKHTIVADVVTPPSTPSRRNKPSSSSCSGDSVSVSAHKSKLSSSQQSTLEDNKSKSSKSPSRSRGSRTSKSDKAPSSSSCPCRARSTSRPHKREQSLVVKEEEGKRRKCPQSVPTRRTERLSPESLLITIGNLPFSLEESSKSGKPSSKKRSKKKIAPAVD
jgi:hypothetical protein